MKRLLRFLFGFAIGVVVAVLAVVLFPSLPPIVAIALGFAAYLVVELVAAAAGRR
jgi:uncharacterized membrane protein YgaE (UPF0421/DUF939 family)